MPPARRNPPRKTPIQRNPDEEASRTAARQWGALTGAQARKTGLSQHQIDHRVRTKRWRRQTRDVFVLAGTRNTWQQQAMVACLSGPPGTVTSHLTAAAVYGLAKAPKEPQVTIPRDANGARIRNVRVRRADLGPGEKAVREPVDDKDGRLLARADLGIVEWKVLLEYDSDEHHGPRCCIADGERMDGVEAETGWRMVSVDRFDLRPSNSNLRERLEKLRPPCGPMAA